MATIKRRRGGRRAGAGRKRGGHNTSITLREAEVASTGDTPLSAMLFRMRYHLARAMAEINKPKLRVRLSERFIERELRIMQEAAQPASPMVHPRYSNVTYERTTKLDLTKLTDDELTRLRDLVTKSVPRLAPGTGPVGGGDRQGGSSPPR